MYKKSKGFIEFPWDVAGRLIAAASDRSSMSSLTHGFYRYPASISPWLARSIIEATTQPGETVLDPFLGGGTTLVESRALGRAGIGIDRQRPLRPGRYDLPELERLMAHAERAVLARRDCWLGGIGRDAAGARKLLARGYHFVTTRADIWLLADGARATVAALRK